MQNKSKSPNLETAAVRAAEKGFSLLELVIAMMIFLIVTGAIYQVLQVAQRSRSLVNDRVQLTKNVRVALNLIGRDTYNAGFGYPLRNTVFLPDNKISDLIGIPDADDNTRDLVPPIIVGNNVTPNTFNTTAGVMTDQVVFLFKDSTFNLIGAAGKQVSQPLNINAATTTGGIDEIVPISGSNAACQINDLFVVTGNTGSALAVVTGLNGANTVQFSNGDVLGFNQTGAGGPLRGITTPASMQRVRMVSYFVTANGTLTRRDYANSSAATVAQNSISEPLVYGVENFQIQYVLNDGTISDNPSAGTDGIPGNGDDTQTDLAKVRQIRVTVSVRSNDLDSSGQPYRINMTSTFSTRNLGYDAS